MFLADGVTLIFFDDMMVNIKFQAEFLSSYINQQKVINEWASEYELSGSLVELCSKPAIVARMQTELAATGKTAGLSKQEMPAKIHIDGSFETGWMPDRNGLNFVL